MAVKEERGHDMVSYGVILRQLRREAGLTQRELAAAIDNRLDFVALSKIENRRIPPPPPEDKAHFYLGIALAASGRQPIYKSATDMMSPEEVTEQLRTAAGRPFEPVASPNYALISALGPGHSTDWWEDRMAEWNEMSEKT